MARLEWQVALTFHSQDTPLYNLARLSEMSEDVWERAEFTFQPSVGLVASAWPIFDLWQARQHKAEYHVLPFKLQIA